MAKHGGYPMGMMGGGNMQALMKQAQKMQENMLKAQEEIAVMETTGTAGGMGSATVYGTKKLESVKIDPQCVDPDDVEMLEDLVLSAVNAAIEAAGSAVETEMGKLTGGLGLGF